MPRVLVITSCTARKGPVPARADALYEGEHHRRLMRGVDALRQDHRWEVDLRVVSAKHGLLSADRRVCPYDETFAGLGRRVVRARGNALGIPGDMRATLGVPADLAVIALGDDYLTAAGLEDGRIDAAAPTLLLCAPGVGRRMVVSPNVQRVDVGVPETRRFSCGFIGLKGEVAGRLLTALAHEPVPVVPTWVTASDVLDHVSAFAPQLALAA